MRKMMLIIAGLLWFGIFSLVTILAIAWSHYPFTFKQIEGDFREFFKALYEGIKP